MYAAVLEISAEPLLSSGEKCEAQINVAEDLVDAAFLKQFDKPALQRLTPAHTKLQNAIEQAESMPNMMGIVERDDFNKILGQALCSQCVSCVSASFEFPCVCECKIVVRLAFLD